MLTSPPEESVEHWGGLEVDDETEVIYGNVLQIGDAAFAYYGFSQSGSDRHVELVNSCAEMLAQYGVKLYDILIPTSVGVVVSSDYMEQLKCTDQGQTISYIFSRVSEDVGRVNVFNRLIEHNDGVPLLPTDHPLDGAGLPTTPTRNSAPRRALSRCRWRTSRRWTWAPSSARSTATARRAPSCGRTTSRPTTRRATSR